MKTLSENVRVGGQLTPEDIHALAADGVKTIINNRPDGEALGQPTHNQIAEAAEAAGLTYHYIPMAGLTQEAVDASIKAFRESPRPIAAFCASGTRSTVLWCFAHAKDQGVDSVLEAAAKAGYPLEQIRHLLTQISVD